MSLEMAGHDHSLKEFKAYRGKMNEKILEQGKLQIKRFLYPSTVFQLPRVFSWFPELEDIGALVPDLDLGGTIHAFRNGPFEPKIAQGMILNFDGQPLDPRFCWWTLGNGPALQDPIEFQSKIPMQPPCVVLLNEKPQTRIF